MGSISDKLSYLNDTKKAIKEAIVNKGVEVLDTDTFKSYAEKILNISGDTTSSEFSPVGISGLCLWLDAEINSRKGIHDASVNGMQNLVFTPSVGNPNGFLEKLNGTPTFKDKAITLGGTCFYPNYNFDELTIELVFQENSNNVPHSTTRLISAYYNTGFQIWLSKAGTIYFQAFNSGNVCTKNVSFTSDFKTQKRYITITTKLSESNSTNIYLDGEKLDLTFDDNIAILMPDGYNMGIGGVRSTNTTSTEFSSSNTLANGSFASGNIDFSLVRMWSRKLSANEIKQNYISDKKRFENINIPTEDNIKCNFFDNYRGLCCYFDSLYNTIDGLDHSKTYIENLIPSGRYSLKGYSYGNASLNSWDGDLLKLNSTLVVECPIQSMPITIEFVGQTNLTAIAYILKTITGGKGFQLYANTNGTENYLDFQILDVGGSYNTLRFTTIEANKTFYCMASIDPSTNVIKLRFNDITKEATLKANFAQITTDMYSGCNIYNPTTSIPSSTGYKQDVMKVGLFKIWNRLLADEEIQANYQDSKKRFNF